jgi:hypothetical protein
VTIAGKQLFMPKRGHRVLEPSLDRHFVKVDKDALPKLLDCRQPIGVARNWRATDAHLNVFNIPSRLYPTTFATGIVSIF